MNPNITWKIVQENTDKLWNWYELSSNPNISWKIVQENPNKPWYYNSLSWNTFGYNKNKTRIIERTKCIKEELMAKTWNPETPLGRYLVEQEAEIN